VYKALKLDWSAPLPKVDVGIGLFHGDSRRKDGTLWTAKGGSTDIESVLAFFIHCHNLILLSCFSGEDMLSPLKEATRLRPGFGILFVDSKRKLYEIAQCIHPLLHGLSLWTSSKETVPLSIAFWQSMQSVKANILSVWWIQSGQAIVLNR